MDSEYELVFQNGTSSELFAKMGSKSSNDQTVVYV